MTLVFRIAVRSAARQLHRRALIGAVVVLAVLAAVSTVIGLRSHAVQTTRYVQLLQQNVRDQARAGLAPGWQVEAALRVLRPLNPAVALVRGVEADSPAYWDFGPGGVIPSGATPIHDADEISPTVDLEFLIRVLLGLFALVVTTSVMSMLEAEGELVGLRSFPISSLRLWAGQLAAAFGLVLMAWGVVALAVVIAAAGVADGDASAAIFRAVGQLMAPTIAYLAFMVSLGAVVPVLVSGLLTRGIAVVLTWLVLSSLLPTTLLSFARIVKPVSSMLAMITSRDSTLAVELRAAEQEMGNVLAGRPLADQPQTNPFQAKQFPYLASIWNTRSEEARQKARGIEAAWRLEEAAHDAWIRRAEWSSPASLFWRAAADATRTGRADRQAWDEAVLEHWEGLRTILFDDRPRVSVSIPADQARQIMAMDRHTALPVRNLPAFSPGRVETLRASAAGSSIAGLLGYTLALTAIGGALFRRR